MGVLASPLMFSSPSGPPSDCSHFISRAHLRDPWMDFFNFAHTHPLEGVDMPFGIYENSPIYMANRQQ